MAQQLPAQLTPPPAPDTAEAVVDSAGIGELAHRVEQAGQLLAEGQWEAAGKGFLVALIDFGLNNLIPAILVGAFFWALLWVTLRLLRRGFRRSRRIDSGVQQLLLRSTRLLIYAFGGIAVLAQLGINVTSLIAGLGILGLALGFAAKDTLENFIAGITILMDRPFRVGDNIQLQETFGTVQEITLRTTRVKTLNNQMAIIPNSKAISEKVINHTMLRALRIDVPFGIAYNENPEEARLVALATTKDDTRLHPDHEPRVVLTGLGDSSVDMELRLHLKDPGLENSARMEYQEKVFNALKNAGIEIPFPHLQLFIDEAKAFERANFMRPN